MKKQPLTSFYLEALLLVVIFVAMILVLTGVFGAARAQSVQARRLTQAVTLAANAAEAATASDSPEQAAALLDEGGNVRLEGGVLSADYRADGSPCADGEPALTVTVSWEDNGGEGSLVTNRIAVFAPGEEESVYAIETAHSRKGAAA